MSINFQYANDIDDYACNIYNKRWPDGTMHKGDIKNVTASDIYRRGIPDLICAGVPCQPSSRAGSQKGKYDTRWLWPETFRLVREVRPRIVVLENPPGIFDVGFDYILASLASLGFTAEWEVLSACMFGAPHTRERVFIVAYPEEIRRGRRRVFEQTAEPLEACRRSVKYVWQRPTKPAVPGMAYGVPYRMDRLHCGGNAVAPIVACFVFMLIIRVFGYFTAVELFAGIGGFRLGSELANQLSLTKQEANQ